MRKLYLLLISLGLVSTLNAQDVILKTNGDEIQAKVKEIGVSEIKYKKFDNKSGPVYTILKSEVFMITYENGSKDWFGRRQETTATTPIVTPTPTPIPTATPKPTPTPTPTVITQTQPVQPAIKPTVTVVKEGDRYGYINNETGKYVIKPKYSAVGEFDVNGICWVQVGGKIDKKTNLPTGGKYGYLSPSGVELTKITYTSVRESFHNGYAWVSKGTKKGTPVKVGSKYVTPKIGKTFGFIDVNGNPVTAIKYDAVQDAFHDGMAGVKLGEYYGYVSTTGKETPIKYIHVGEFNNGLGLVVVNPKDKNELPKYGYINIDGQEVINPIYDDAQEQFSEERSFVKKDRKWAVIDTKGNFLSNFDYGGVKDFKNGLAQVSKSGYPMQYVKNNASYLWGFIDKNATLVVPYRYIFVDEEIDEYGLRQVSTVAPLAWSQTNKQITSVRAANADSKTSWTGLSFSIKEQIWKNTFDEKTARIYNAIGTKKITKLNEIKSEETKIGLQELKADTKNRQVEQSGYGWINIEAKEVIACIYSKAGKFSEGLAAVAKKSTDNIIYINTQQETVLQTDYTDGTIFEDGVACVKDKNGKWGGIDNKGNIVIPIFAETSEEARDIANTMYVQNDRKPLTNRHTKLYLLYKKRPQDKYKVKDNIPNDMWDF